MKTLLRTLMLALGLAGASSALAVPVSSILLFEQNGYTFSLEMGVVDETDPEGFLRSIHYVNGFNVATGGLTGYTDYPLSPMPPQLNWGLNYIQNRVIATDYLTDPVYFTLVDPATVPDAASTALLLAGTLGCIAAVRNRSRLLG